MKRWICLLFLCLTLSAAVAPAATQFEAGFLDSCTSHCSDPYSIFSGTAWYCYEVYGYEYEGGFWYPVKTLISGPHEFEPGTHSTPFCYEY